MKSLLGFFLVAVPFISFASLFCPGTGFNQINIGDSIAQVQAQCGPPASMKTVQSEVNQPQEWSYFIEVKPGAGSLKMTVAFVDKKLVNIVVNGTSLITTTICNHMPIYLKDPIEKVQSVCGKPAFITQNTAAAKTAFGNSPQPTETTELIYETSPAVSLIFENGKLIQRK